MARKIKLPDTVAYHDDVNVRLAASFLLQALEAAKRGSIEDMAASIRCAYMYEQDIPNTIRLGVE